LLADRAGGGKRGVVLHVDHELVAVEERVRVLADPAGELRLSHVRGLRLSGQDIAARLGDGVVKLASGEEHERGLNEGHEKRAKMAPPPGRIRRLRRRVRHAAEIGNERNNLTGAINRSDIATIMAQELSGCARCPNC
jgi:hypothetical protein